MIVCHYKRVEGNVYEASCYCYFDCVASKLKDIKLCFKTGVHERPLFWRDMYGAALARAFNLVFVFLERPFLWVSKLSLLSI